MSKVIVEIYFPQLDMLYDYVLPVHMTVQEVINLVNDTIADMEGLTQSSDDLALYLADNGTILNETVKLSQTDIKDGSCLFIC